MPHISSKKIDKENLEKIYKLIFAAITDSNIQKYKQERAFNELLTPTEKIMLGKRLSAVSMLSNGGTPYGVGKALELSQSTTIKLKLKIDKGLFKNTESLCKALNKGPLQHYMENLFKPLPRYGTSPHTLFRK